MIHTPKYKIVQPDGVNYMIQKVFYEKYQAQDYINMLINKSNEYIKLKQKGKRAAPLMTIERLKSQLENIKQFKIVPIEE